MCLLFGLITGCSIYSSSTGALTTQCNVPTDQSGTISGHWPANPIPIAFHAGDFSSNEMSAIMAAADTWNQFFNSSQSLSLISYGSQSSPNISYASKPAGTCTTGIISNNQFTGQVVIYKDAAWPYTNLSSAIALTSYCPIPASPMNTFYMAFTEINYQNFFVNGTKLPDLQSIITHEFGHLAGLNHSCENYTKSGTPLCTDPNINSDYLSASMFPVFGFDSSGNGEVRRSLNLNDESRANCLYGNAGSGNPNGG